MKQLIKTVGVILSIAIFSGMIFISPVQAGASDLTRTVMLYCIGSDLERSDKFATNTFINAMEAEYDENVSFIVMTGGSVKWHTPSEYLNGAEKIDPSYNQIWKLEGKHAEEDHGEMTLLEEKGIEGFEKASMIQPGTLTSFLDYCYENYPSDCYEMIFWDHGGGPAYGFGYDYNRDDLSMSETALAFSESKLIKSQKRLDMLIYDCCLMGNTEMITALSDYADYFICSPEEVPGGGIDHRIWLDSVKADPSLSGAEIGKLIVDDFVEAYNDSEDYSEHAVMAVVDTKKYKEQMLPLLSELSAILLDEATVCGENGFYNFYDEIYSSGAAYWYGSENYSLCDLESIISPLSCRQFETDADAEELSNRYTDIAMAILENIAESNSVYFGSGDFVYSYVEGRNLRNRDGVFAYIGDEPSIVKPTGLSVFYPLGDIELAYDYIIAVQETLEVMQDGEAKTFLSRYASAAACYALIYEFGKTLSSLNAEDSGNVTFDDVKDRLQMEDKLDSFISPLISFLGEYAFSSISEAEAYLSDIVSQQAGDVITSDMISVNNHKLSISNPSVNSLTGVSSNVVIKGSPSCLEFKMLLSVHGYSYFNRDKYFPNGFFFTISSNYTGKFETVTGSPLEVEIQDPPDTVFAVYDSNGIPHIADLHFTNALHTAGYIPLVVLRGLNIEKNYYLYVSKTDDGWHIDGLSEMIGGPYIPMESDNFTPVNNEISYTTVSVMTDAVYGLTTLLPISDFCNLDKSIETWGMTVRELRSDEVPESYNCGSYFMLRDIYGNTIDITDIVLRAEAVSLLGDADGDGSVTILDTTAIQQYLAYLPVSDTFNYTTACVSGDELSIIDATYIQLYLAKYEVPYAIGESVNG